eukprot:gene2766-3440_t
MRESQDRDNNPYQLSPRYRNKIPVSRKELGDCSEALSDYGICLAETNFQPSECANELKKLDECKRNQSS